MHAKAPPGPAPFVFPARARGAATALVVVPAAEVLPELAWLGPAPADGFDSRAAADAVAALAPRPGTPLLAEQSRGSLRRPGLRGHRLDRAGATGHDWSTAFRPTGLSVEDTRLTLSAADDAAGLALGTEVQALPGGALRLRHTVTNTGTGRYVVDALEVGVPAGDDAAELLDFTGRHERERSPQRHEIRDGLWLRENRRGRTGLEAATLLVAGVPGFGFGAGALVAAHVAWSGNTVHWAERDPGGGVVLGGGELLLPGEVALAPGESYSTPWLFVVAAEGLDAAAAALHTWQRSLPAHPAPSPVTLNVWEAVYFDHDLARLSALADRAAAVGVERYVLDDGWFLGRRHAGAGLGDWAVDPAVWPHGLHPLVDHVRRLGLQFGLWFEPEMVNPDSQLYRDHPAWALGVPGRVPLLARNQLVLDLTNDAVRDHLLERMDALLGEYPIDYVKWDHNRDLLEAAAGPAGRPAAHRQTQAYYALLDELRRRHPAVSWESCASGGGRIDLEVLPRVQRVWTSDMTDALARQQIQRWTVQLVAPEYLGAHVSAPTSHQTGRTLPLDFRAATALFGSFGLEWDLTGAGAAELDALREWIGRYRTYRELLHTGRTVRVASTDPAVWLHGVVATDRRSALFAHVQLDESAGGRGVVLRMPHLDPSLRYRLTWAAPPDQGRVSQAPPVDPAGPTGGVPVGGETLGRVGVWLPRRRPETILLVHVAALEGETRT